MLSAIVLAAGLSQRMGTANKLLLSYKNKTIIETTVENILAADIGEVIVVAGHEAEQIQSALKNLQVHFVFNPGYANGITTSIQHGVEYAKGNGYMVCLSDMVLITPAEYTLLKTAFEQQITLDYKCICLPRFNHKKGNPVIFSSFYKEAILKHEDMEGCKDIVQLNNEHIYWVDMDTPHILQDMDYFEDYEKLNL